MTDIILFSSGLLLISTLIVYFLFGLKLVKTKAIFFSLLLTVITGIIYTFKSNLKSFTYMDDLNKNIIEGKGINPNEVIIFLENKLNKNPKDLDAWLVLARTCLITGHIQKSELYYNKGLKYFPRSEDLLLESAILKKSNFDYLNSLKFIKRLLNINSKNVAARMLYVELMLITGELKKAEQKLRELSQDIEIDSDWLQKLNKLRSN